MLVKNIHELSTTALREQALSVIEAGIQSVLPENIMKSLLRYDLPGKSLKIKDVEYSMAKGRIFVIGGGKAAGTMAEALENSIGSENIFAGVVNCKSGDYRTVRIKIMKASHPFPDDRGLKGMKQMLALKEKYAINEHDLVICLLSGGASALMPCPVDGISLQNKQKVTELLLRCGAEIHEINAVRKHLSRIKGGWLGKFYSPAKVISLIISDVIGDSLDVIASGPTFPDSSTFQDAYSVLEKYDLIGKAPENIVAYLKRGCQGEVKETPKELTNCENHIVGNNRLALKAMAKKAKEQGFTPCIVTSEQKGDTAEVARARASEIIEGKYSGYTALLIGGETTPTLPDNAGRGGRNQHYAAISMRAMQAYPEQWIVASVGTDGSDYLPDVAGAMVDNDILSKAVSRGLDVQKYIDKYDSYRLFRKLGKSLIITGDTGTNVSDIVLYLLGK